ncbi:MAG: glycosyltransferase [Synergistaceae bacterium]|nr:glycosyltransferase [Synergistaceae bacterium]
MPSMIPSVAVIMSTYNGERYLAEQIDSILAQKNVHVELFIRDDGSKDNTREIISDYVKKYNNIHAEFGSNMGWIRSFIYALQNAPDFDYYAFSDQDDFWLEEKLITAVNAIQREENEYGKNIPVICQTNAFITDGNLNVLKQTHTEGRLATVYSFALREIGRGCCMVLNAKVRELSRHMNDSKLFYDKAHDVALAEMTVAVGGRFVIEPAPLMKYRQHGDNSLGAPSSLMKRIKYELIALTDKKGNESGFFRLLLQYLNDELTPDARKAYTLITGSPKNWLYRLRILFSPKFRTGDFRATILGKLRVLIGYI